MFIYNRFFLISVCAILFLGTSKIFGGATETYLQKYNIEDILTVVKEKYEFNDSELANMIETVLSISKNEDDNRFFGYHAISQNTRLFEDILNVVFKEILHIEIPNDFYFLRIPNVNKWNWENGKLSFIEYYQNKEITNEYKELIISNFLLIVRNEFGININLNDFSKKDAIVIWDLFKEFLDERFWHSWLNKARKYAIPNEIESIEIKFPKDKLVEAIDLIIKKSHTSTENINPESLKSGMIDFFSDFYNMTAVFLLREIEFDDENIKNAIEFLDLRFYDVLPPQNAQLLSLNASVLGNFTNSGSFSAGIFFENKSVLGGDNNYEKILKEFFNEIGLDELLASQIWHEGQKILSQAVEKRGCLLQFFDYSVDRDKIPLSLADRDLYVSFIHGIPIFDVIPSKYLQGGYTLTDKKKDMELRLVLNNKTNLNPFSSIRIKRYDGLVGLDPEAIQNKIYERLKQADKDNVKIELYKDKLKQLWEISSF